MLTGSENSAANSQRSSASSDAPLDPQLADLIRELETLAARWLARQQIRLQAIGSPPSPKVINDAIWGPIRLHSWEVALLDTELLQRLRFIRQLGVVHWVYPSASHSRFEHSLGTLHQMQQLIDGIERSSGRAAVRAIDDLTTNILRLSALLHDIGHTVMSHVSESNVVLLPGVKALQAYLQRQFGGWQPPSASEAFAAVFVRSPAFRTFLQLREVGADFINDVDEVTKQIASFIVGGPGGRGHLTPLVNGAFDADKLDYMPRDTRLAGVPCAVDVARVVEKVHLVHVRASELPAEYIAWLGAAVDPESVPVLAIASSGARTLDELAMTRTILFEKVYYHHKVRALEVMVRRLLDNLTSTGRLQTATEWLELSDDALLLEDDPIASALRNRDILKRAFFIRQPAKPESVVDEQEARDIIAEQTTTILDSVDDGSMRTAIINRARVLAAALDIDPAPLAQLEIDFPSLTKIGLDQYAWVGDDSSDLHRVNAARSGGRAEATRHVARAGSNVFAPELVILPAFLAAYQELTGNYAQTYDTSCYTHTKLDPAEILDAWNRLKLPADNFTSSLKKHDRPHRVRSLESFLRSAMPRIEAVATLFGQYQSADAQPVSPQRVADFLRQFEDEGIARPALRLLESLSFRNRRFFARALGQKLADARQHGPIAGIAPLGGSGDSSTLLSYLVSDLPKEQQVRVRQLERTLELGTDDQIMLWDDFIGRGGHAETTIYQWLELHDSEANLLDEDLVEPLAAQRKKLFRDTPITICFALGMKSGIERLRDFLARNSLKNVTVLDPVEIVPETDDVFGDPSVCRDQLERERLEAFLRLRGFDLLQDRIERSTNPWSKERVENCVLGYGNTAQRLVFFYNVPTVTITALWQSGKKWNALFSRRPKPSSVT